MATTLGTLRTRVRTLLLETTASFWTDAELLDHLLAGAKDMWGALIDLNAEHYSTEDATNVSQAASTATLTGIPTDCFRILHIEPRDITTAGTGRGILYVPKDYNSLEFTAARAQGTLSSDAVGVVYYEPRSAGPPVDTMTVRVAPLLSAALTLRVKYCPTLSSSLDASSNNPIPGESDNALVAWCIAYARAKEREDRSPDPNWLKIYGTEKDNILTRATPRQSQEPDVVEDLFGG